ncbi:MAG TPA: glycosyltransferase family 4 protein, partial [Actinomycetota bacterium]|nr:glycosyltransferase family 4 protein [Actinomycetota bacterium]
YARVLREVLPRLTPDLDVTLFALNTRDAAATSSLPGVRVVVNGLLGDPYGREQLPRLVDETQPDVVLLHHDLPLYSVFHEGLAEYRAARPHFRVIAYCPIEWEGTSEGNVRTLAGVDAAVTYTEFGARAVERAFAGRADAPRVAVIGHGIDTSTFRPVAGARRALWPDRPELEDAFVVLNANRNVPRKKIDLTMSAFAEFAAGKPDTYLYLHMGMLDNGIDVPVHARELGITDRLLVTTDDQAPPKIGDEELNLVYNACDVGLNTATGEGWGLVAFEHGATGAAQVMPDHSACAELWRDRALFAPVEPGREEDGLVSRDGVVAALERLYADGGLRARLGEAAREHALDPSFDWDTIAQSWRALLLDGPPRRDA